MNKSLYFPKVDIDNPMLHNLLFYHMIDMGRTILQKSLFLPCSWYLYPYEFMCSYILSLIKTRILQKFIVLTIPESHHIIDKMIDIILLFTIIDNVRTKQNY